MRNIHKRLCSVCGSATVDRSTFGRSVKCYQPPKQEEKNSLFCLAQAVLSQLLVLKCCNVLMPSFVGIDASQLDNWRPVFRSAKKVLGTSSGILGIRRRARDGLLGASQSQPKTESKAISAELLAHFEAEGEITLSHIVIANETWVMAWHHPQPLRKKVSRKSQTARKLMITVFWDCEGVTSGFVTERRDN